MIQTLFHCCIIYSTAFDCIIQLCMTMVVYCMNQAAIAGYPTELAWLAVFGRIERPHKVNSGV